MLYDMSTFHPDMESLAADSEDYSTYRLRTHSCSTNLHLATHGYRDLDAGMPEDTTSVDIDSLLDDVDAYQDR